jgi:hypothetical protein
LIIYLRVVKNRHGDPTMSFSKKTIFLIICSASACFAVLNTETKNPVQAAWHAKKTHNKQKRVRREKRVTLHNRNAQQKRDFISNKIWPMLATALLVPIALCTAAVGMYFAIGALYFISNGFMVSYAIAAGITYGILPLSISAGSTYLLVRNIKNYHSYN